jgi:hypothetical protein
MSSSIVTNKFRYRIVKTLEDKFSDDSESVYFFYGQSIEWLDENTPDTAEPTVEQENDTKSNILALKKISGRDLILGAEKREWASGIQYDIYSDREDLTTKNYYVVASNQQVYKCLDNNTVLNEGGFPAITPSLDEPTHIGGTVVRNENDGYLWKHMFGISEAIQRKFNIPEYIPVTVADSETQGIISSTTPGTVDNVTIDPDPLSPAAAYGGVGYYIQTFDNNYNVVELQDIPIFIDGDGDEVATGKIQIQQISATGGINITASTSSTEVTGYYDVVNPGQSTTAGFSINLGDRGNGYRLVDDEWVPVKIRQISSESTIENIDINASFDYAYGIAKINENGSINALRIVNPGSGYTIGEAEIVQSSAIAFAKTNASYLTSDLEDRGRIISVRTEYPGANFSRADAVIVSDKFGGNLAYLSPIVSPIKGHGFNPEVELNATNILFNIRVAYEELGGDFSVGNDFRSVGLVENVEQQDNAGTGVIDAISLTLDAKTSITCTDIIDANDFQGDDLLIGTTSGARARIVDVINGNTIRVIRDIETSNTTSFLENEFLISSSAGTAQAESISLPEYVPFSGDVLFINNRQQIQRSNDQIETINFILKL